MKFKKRVTTLLALLLSITISEPVIASDIDELSELLQDFLVAAHSLHAHERFWADDLVYTSSAGLRFGKPDILESFDAGSAAPDTLYSATDVDIRVFDDAAIIAFKLVGEPAFDTGETAAQYYFNTGTFLKRDGVWRAIAWQATSIPEQE